MCSGSARSWGELTIRSGELQGFQIHVWHMQELWDSNWDQAMKTFFKAAK